MSWCRADADGSGFATSSSKIAYVDIAVARSEPKTGEIPHRDVVAVVFERLMPLQWTGKLAVKMAERRGAPIGDFLGLTFVPLIDTLLIASSSLGVSRELHLPLFPRGLTATRARVAKLKSNYENEQQN